MHALVGVVMGSNSDWPTMKLCHEILQSLEVPHECKIISAHRTPDQMFSYAENAAQNNLEVIIAGAGGAAHLPGMLASKTYLPVIGVPIKSKTLNGMDSLLSIVQMPKGVPVGTVAIGESGAINAALFAASILSNKYPQIKNRLESFRKNQTQSVIESSPLL